MSEMTGLLLILCFSSMQCVAEHHNWPGQSCIAMSSKHANNNRKCPRWLYCG